MPTSYSQARSAGAMSVESGGFSRVHRKQRLFPGSELIENLPGAPLHANAVCDVTAVGISSLTHSSREAAGLQ